MIGHRALGNSMKSTAVKNYISMWNYTKHPSTRFAKVNETSTMVRLRKRIHLLDCSFVQTVRKTFSKKNYFAQFLLKKYVVSSLV